MNLGSKSKKVADNFASNNQLTEGRNDNTSIKVEITSQRCSVKIGNTSKSQHTSFKISTLLKHSDSLAFCLNRIKALNIH